MQMGTGRASGHADGADARPRFDAFAGLYIDCAQMAVHAHEAAAMVDEYRVAVEKKRTCVDHSAGDRRQHGSAAMSMPLCGLRDSPLKILREPNELLRGPGTGGGN